MLAVKSLPATAAGHGKGWKKASAGTAGNDRPAQLLEIKLSTMEKLFEILFFAGAVVFAFAAIGFCILSHELGHFLAARLCGLQVDAFSLGFKAFWKKKYKGVEYRLGYLPFGGYCEIPQVDCSDGVPKSADGTELPPAKPWARIVTAFAGPFFNIISGLLIGCLVWWIGMPQDSPKVREFTVLAVEAGSPEAAAGLQQGDRIISLNGEKFFDTWAKFVEKLMFTIGEVRLEVLRDGKVVQVKYQPKLNPNAPERLRIEGVAWPFFKVLIPIELVPQPGSPAENAGIRKGDFIVSVNGEDISDYQQFQFALNIAGGKPAKLVLMRQGQKVEVTVTPELLPGAENGQFDHFLTGIGLKNLPDGKGFVIDHIYPGLPAAKAGLQQGDRPTAINGKDIAAAGAAAFVAEIQQLKDRPFELAFIRGGKVHKITLHAERISPRTIGVSLSLLDHPTPIQQFTATVAMSWKSLRNIGIAVGNKLGLTDQQSTLKPRHMSGPLGMGMVLFSMVHQSSLMSGIYFMVVISFALAIFNLLPLPVLDGGHILFGLIEIIIRRRVSPQLVKVLSNIFVVLLIGLMLYVTVFDVRRIYYLVSGKKPDAPAAVEGKTAPAAPEKVPAKATDTEKK